MHYAEKAARRMARRFGALGRRSRELVRYAG
jgi:hypothetical protein